MENKAEDFQMLMSLNINKQQIEDIRCKVFLPKKVTDPITLHFYPTQEQIKNIPPFSEGSIHGFIKNINDDICLEVSSSLVYIEKPLTRQWGPNLIEGILIGHPENLKVVENIQNENADDKTIHGRFWLTPSVMLAPANIFERSHTGHVNVKTVRQFDFLLPNGVKLIFDKCFKYDDEKNGEGTITFEELVAEFQIDTQPKVTDQLLPILDNFLMLVSFSQRYRSICLGWELHKRDSYVRYYRRDQAIPEVVTTTHFKDSLIDIQRFEKFINTTYNNFVQLDHQELLRQAIQHTINNQSQKNTLENSFLTLYAALDTLVLFFRRKHMNENIFDPHKEWAEIEKDLKTYLKNHPLLKDDEYKRVQIDENLSKLNEISFSNVFHRFCEYYSVDLSNLWPVVDDTHGIALAGIRDKLVQGDFLNPLQLDSLIVAREHLLWIVERLILVILGWPIEESNVGIPFVMKIDHESEWKKAREAFLKDSHRLLS